MDTKQCSCCGEIKPIEQFNLVNDKRRPNKRRSYCRQCDYQKRKATPSYAALRKRRAQIDHRRARERARELKQELCVDGCVVCGEKELCCLHLHHLDPTTKGHTPNRLIAKGKAKLLKKEFAKGMVVLCANCHAKVHAGVISLPNHLLPV